MHPSSLENMQWCVRRYAAARLQAGGAGLTVLDVGGANVNGSYADLFRVPGLRYLGTDLAPGEGVDLVLEDPYRLPLADASIDYVISGQMLEHCEFFWLAFAEMVRVLKPDGYLFLIAPSAGPIHRYPVDCYRYYPDAYRALAKHAGCHLIDLRHDERGPWNDLVGVFAKTAQPKSRPHTASWAPAPHRPQWPADAEQEALKGARPYLEVLADLHEALQPAAYLEIGVRFGRSLRLARGPALGVDPAPELQVELPASTTLLRMGSDDFFDDEAERLKTLAPDFVFIDGMHLFEYALRDFMHVERVLGPGTVVVIDDVFPNHPAQALRARATRSWTGDVWRLLPALQANRPDLILCALDTAPTGLLIIAGLDGSQRGLWQRYNALTTTAQRKPVDPPPKVLARRGALRPEGGAYREVLSLLQTFRAEVATDAGARERLRSALRERACLLDR
ncbi:MAG TPA: methyltransferase domain-containing protein [Methylibium sp.]|nr:methyltransferase domain-containing protein [Methylibium sp.]